MNTELQAHRELLVLGGEVVLVLALATVADNLPGWGPPILLLFALLWGLFLIGHSEQLRSMVP